MATLAAHTAESLAFSGFTTGFFGFVALHNNPYNNLLSDIAQRFSSDCIAVKATPASR
jgi:hypothetical protein